MNHLAHGSGGSLIFIPCKKIFHRKMTKIKLSNGAGNEKALARRMQIHKTESRIERREKSLNGGGSRAEW
jgi:hypothetical protein